MSNKRKKQPNNGMTLPTRFIVKPDIDPVELNKSIVKMAILNQIFLENFSSIASTLHDWNNKVIVRAEKHERDIEHLQSLIYDDYFTLYEQTLQDTSIAVERVINILIESSLDDIHDVDCFLEIKRRNKLNGTREYLDFLIKNTELINEEQLQEA